VSYLQTSAKKVDQVNMNTATYNFWFRMKKEKVIQECIMWYLTWESFQMLSQKFQTEILCQTLSWSPIFVLSREINLICFVTLSAIGDYLAKILSGCVSDLVWYLVFSSLNDLFVTLYQIKEKTERRILRNNTKLFDIK